jgi:uncharacterized protein
MNQQLLNAVLQPDLSALKRLIQAEVDLNDRDDTGRTVLMHAVIDGISETVQLLLESGALPNLQDKSGFTALHFAAQNYCIEAARLLLQGGANVDVCDDFGNTPLGKAVYGSKGRGEMILMLLEAGADPLRKNLSGVSPAELAQRIANYDVRQFLSKSSG